MRVAERATPVAAVIAALSTLACCLPFAFLGAIGLAVASVKLHLARPWLLASAGMLLVVGFAQLYLRRNQCRSLRGASAIEKWLEQARSLPIRVLVVWEPILPTDWSRPSGMVQSRISDTRVIQYWDDDHLIAGELRHQLSSEPSCCQRSGVLWDLAVLYGRQAQWGNSSPPLFAGGPVVKAAPVLEERFAGLSGKTGD